MTDSNLPPALMAAMDILQPIFEAGTGLRAKLEQQGWSPTVAESIAHEVILTVIRQIAPGGKK